MNRLALLIEDDAGIRKALSRLLPQQCGVVVLEAQSVREALAHQQHARELGLEPVVISDFDLHNGETGADVYHALGQPPRFVLHTGNATASIPGVPRVLKPNIDELVAQVRQWTL